MTWLMWRQHRMEVMLAGLVILLIGAGVIALIASSAGLMAEAGRACSQPGTDCGPRINELHTAIGRYETLIIGAGLILPALLGAFIGAPAVAREYEAGTDQLIWTQGISRRRWFAFKAGFIAAGALVGAGVLGILLHSLIGPESAITNVWNEFEVAPPVLAGYSVFAVALGTAAGAAIRRVVPAMAATILAFTALRVGVGSLARPRYMAPGVWEVGSDSPASSVWLIGPLRRVDPKGRPVSEQRFQEISNAYSSAVGPKPGGRDFVSYHDFLRDHGVILLQQYQPGSRMWPFQAIEMLLFFVMALALFAVAYRLVVPSSPSE